MWQSRVENERYSVTLEIEFIVAIKLTGHPLRSVQVRVLSVASTRSYALSSAVTSKHLLKYSRDATIAQLCNVEWRSV